MKNKGAPFLLIIMLFAGLVAFGQQDTSVQKENSFKRKVKKPSSSLKSSSDKLAKSISDEEDNTQVAADYYALAKELIKKNDLVKAEAYLKKAIQQLVPDKNAGVLSNYYRELARVQELLKKNDDAAKNFDLAAAFCDDNVLKQLNTNDANRLRAGVSPQKKLEILNENAEILNTRQGYSQERAQNYTKIADENAKLKEPGLAIKNYENALKEVDAGTYESKVIKSNMADVYAGEKMLDSAIQIQQSLLGFSSVAGNGATDDDELQIANMRKLAELYLRNNNAASALKTYNEAYKLAVSGGYLQETRLTLEALVDFYKKRNNHQQALRLYHEFVNDLDSLIARDSSLVDIKLFQYSEEKIAQLEKEQVLKDELIERKNNNNSVLLVSVFLLVILLILIVKAWLAIRKKNKQIALQSLRREMNPHFLFNSLNSVNQFIAGNNELAANKYLSSYAGLMRRIMENSNRDFISLSSELEQITKYLELEKLRFSEKFDYSISIDETLDNDTVMVPNMIIQPNLENAIWHGLRYRETKGSLHIAFSKEGKENRVTITDNGIGYAQSQLLKTENQKQYESRGLHNVEERINLLNQLNKSYITMDIFDKGAPESGVIVTIKWQA